jgi:tetratricopeptide (TPR) repeat protein
MDLNQVLIESAKDGNMLVLKTALEKGADINAKDGSGMTALIYATRRGDEEIVNFLKEKGVKKEEIDFWVAYFKSDEYPKSIEDYTKAIELNPQYADAYYNRGVAHDDLGEYQKAIEDYTKAIELNPQYADAYSDRGYVYNKIGKYWKAVDDYNKAIELGSKYTYAYFTRGYAHGELCQYQKAIDDYTKAIELTPQHASAYNNRGNVYNELGEHHKAIDDYYQSGILYLKQNTNTRALKYIDLMKKIDPSSPLIDKLQDLIDKI